MKLSVTVINHHNGATFLHRKSCERASTESLIAELRSSEQANILGSTWVRNIGSIVISGRGKLLYLMVEICKIER